MITVPAASPATAYTGGVKQLRGFWLGTLLLAGCGAVSVPSFSAQDVAAAPSVAVLGGVTIRVNASAGNDDFPRVGGGSQGPTGLEVTLTGDRPLPTNIRVEGLYAVSAGQVYGVKATGREASGDAQLVYQGLISPKVSSSVPLTMAALITDGTTTQLVRDPDEVTIVSAQ